MAEKQKTNYAKELTKGFLKENPVLRLVLGTCPTLATSTSVVSRYSCFFGNNLSHSRNSDV